jgi:Family of unknown function (DUF6166)
MRVRMKTYVGRLMQGVPLVYVIQIDGDSRLLEFKATYGRLHEWGRSGAGSLQLAYDLLLDASGDADVALTIHHAFQQKYIIPLARHRKWKMTERSVLSAAVLLAATGEKQ